MLYYWLLFFFVAVGAKLLLALVMVYLLLPSDGRCNGCDEETLLIRPTRLGRLMWGLSLRRIQWRWCPRCGWEGLARCSGRHPHSPALQSRSAPTRRPARRLTSWDDLER